MFVPDQEILYRFDHRLYSFYKSKFLSGYEFLDPLYFFVALAKKNSLMIL